MFIIFTLELATLPSDLLPEGTFYVIFKNIYIYMHDIILSKIVNFSVFSMKPFPGNLLHLPLVWEGGGGGEGSKHSWHETILNFH